MSDLPDLDTDEISFIGFWNAIDDGGVDSIEPEDCLDNDNLQEYTLYDNGWDGKYEFDYHEGGPREFDVRVKSDGWFIAYLDRTENYSIKDERPNINGPWDIIYDWTGSTNENLDRNVLTEIIDSLRSDQDNSGDMSFAHQDVGLYEYSREDYDGWALFASGYDEEEAGSSITEDVGFLHTGVEIVSSVLVTSLHGVPGGDGGEIVWDPDDTEVELGSFSGGNYQASSLDTTESETDILDSDTEYKTYYHVDYKGTAGVNHLIWYKEQ